MPPTEARFYRYAVEKARLRDRVYFCSDTTAARDLGVSRRTIIRWRLALEKEGRLVRTTHPCSQFRTICYRFPGRRVTQRTSCRKPLQKPSLRSGFCRQAMSGEISAHENVQLSAHDVLVTVCDTFTASGIPIPTRHKGILARNAKELLSDGFEYETIVVASVIALKRGAPQHVQWIASDLTMARGGQRMSRREYEKALQDEMEVGRGRT